MTAGPTPTGTATVSLHEVFLAYEAKYEIDLSSCENASYKDAACGKALKKAGKAAAELKRKIATTPALKGRHDHFVEAADKLIELVAMPRETSCFSMGKAPTLSKQLTAETLTSLCLLMAYSVEHQWSQLKSESMVVKEGGSP